MGFKATKNSGEAFQRDLAPEGNHRACIVAVIYLGAHMERTWRDIKRGGRVKRDRG